MATTAWKDPGTVVSSTRSGGAVSWTNPTRALTSNDSFSTAALTLNGTHWLLATNFGFTTSDIPSGSTIVGIEIQVERNQTSGVGVEGPTTSYYKIWINAEAGTEKTDSGHLPTTDTVVTKGGASDVWGTTMTDAQARASTTGFTFAITDLDYSSTTVSVDNVKMRYHYTAPAAGRNWGTVMGCLAILLTVCERLVSATQACGVSPCPGCGAVSTAQFRWGYRGSRQSRSIRVLRLAQDARSPNLRASESSVRRRPPASRKGRAAAQRSGLQTR